MSTYVSTRYTHNKKSLNKKYIRYIERERQTDEAVVFMMWLRNRRWGWHMARHANHYMHQHNERTEHNFWLTRAPRDQNPKRERETKNRKNISHKSGKILIWHTYATNYSTALFYIFNERVCRYRNAKFARFHWKKRGFFSSFSPCPLFFTEIMIFFAFQYRMYLCVVMRYQYILRECVCCVVCEIQYIA
jgi:hypothetical protein